MFRKKTGRTDEGYIKALFRAPDSMNVDEQASRSLRYHKQRFQPINSLPLPTKIIKNNPNDPTPQVQSNCSRAYVNDFAYSNGRGVMTTYCCWVGTCRMIRPNTIEKSG